MHVSGPPLGERIEQVRTGAEPLTGPLRPDYGTKSWIFGLGHISQLAASPAVETLTAVEIQQRAASPAAGSRRAAEPFARTAEVNRRCRQRHALLNRAPRLGLRSTPGKAQHHGVGMWHNLDAATHRERRLIGEDPQKI